MSRRIDWDKVNRQKRVIKVPGSQAPSASSIPPKIPGVPSKPDLPMTNSEKEWFERAKAKHTEKWKSSRPIATKRAEEERLRREAQWEEVKQSSSRRKKK